MPPAFQPPNAIDARDADAETLGYVLTLHALASEPDDVVRLGAGSRRAALVLALTLRPLDAFALAFKHDLALELPNGTKNVEDELAGRRRGVDAHREDAQPDALCRSTILTKSATLRANLSNLVTTIASPSLAKSSASSSAMRGPIALVRSLNSLSTPAAFRSRCCASKPAASSSKREVILAIEPGVDQALDDGENKRGREAEH